MSRMVWVIAIGVFLFGISVAMGQPVPNQPSAPSSVPVSSPAPTTANPAADAAPTGPRQGDLLTFHTAGQPDRQVRVVRLAPANDPDGLVDVLDMGTGARYSIPAKVFASMSRNASISQPPAVPPRPQGPPNPPPLPNYNQTVPPLNLTPNLERDPSRDLSRYTPPRPVPADENGWPKQTSTVALTSAQKFPTSGGFPTSAKGAVNPLQSKTATKDDAKSAVPSVENVRNMMKPDRPMPTPTYAVGRSKTVDPANPWQAQRTPASTTPQPATIPAPLRAPASTIQQASAPLPPPAPPAWVPLSTTAHIPQNPPTLAANLPAMPPSVPPTEQAPPASVAANNPTWTTAPSAQAANLPAPLPPFSTGPARLEAPAPAMTPTLQPPVITNQPTNTAMATNVVPEFKSVPVVTTYKPPESAFMPNPSIGIAPAPSVTPVLSTPTTVSAPPAPSIAPTPTVQVASATAAEPVRRSSVLPAVSVPSVALPTAAEPGSVLPKLAVPVVQVSNAGPPVIPQKAVPAPVLPNNSLALPPIQPSTSNVRAPNVIVKAPEYVPVPLSDIELDPVPATATAAVTPSPAPTLTPSPAPAIPAPPAVTASAPPVPTLPAPSVPTPAVAATLPTPAATPPAPAAPAPLPAFTPVPQTAVATSPAPTQSLIQPSIAPETLVEQLMQPLPQVMVEEIQPYVYSLFVSLRPSLRERGAVALAQCRFGSKPEVKAIIARAAMQDLAPNVRATCINLLAELGYHEQSYVDYLDISADSGSSEVKQAALKALSKLAPRK